MKILSSSIKNDYFVPNCGCHGINASPAFEIIDAPSNTVSFALLLEDRDAFSITGGFSWIHWSACNIKTPGLPENASASGEFTQGLNSFISPQGGSMDPEKCIGYCGMSPPDEAHLYSLHVYAIDTELDIDSGFNTNHMFRLMRGHILDEVTIDAWYDKA